jgi:hypothetical protein
VGQRPLLLSFEEGGGKVMNLAIIALVLIVVFLVIHGVLPRWHR